MEREGTGVDERAQQRGGAVSYLLNDPSSFREEMIDGFVAANSVFVRSVEGGVVRATHTPPGEVAVVVGGGSGHYPAFGGLVGAGLAHGAAMGDVFASPSAQHVYSVAKAAASDAGVLLTYGNYAGDVLNFDMAQARLNAEGIACRTVVVTDDIESAAAQEAHKRRGIAGDFLVFRAAGWAAAQGRSLDQVWELASRANERTRTLGVAFSGCTLPGAQQPLFTVARGTMAVGMGIHGEPGIDPEAPMPTAAELAQMLVTRLLAAAPNLPAGADAMRVAVILNGLGSVKYEELFLTYGFVARQLRAAGLTIVAPEVGEFVTSFEMAGVSLTVSWLDEELEQAWLSPAATPAYRQGGVQPAAADRDRDAASTTGDHAAFPAASLESQRAAADVVAALRAIRDVLDEQVDELGRLDAIAGDGDHGIGMRRGSAAGLEAAEKAGKVGAGAGSALASAADAWAARAGGSSGALWGLALRAVADSIGDERAPHGEAVACGVRGASEAISATGGARLGDKTMLDALIPFAEALSKRTQSGAPLPEAWAAAAEVAHTAAQSTAQLQPRIGRARPHAERSIGTPDPGAVSLALAVTAVASTLATTEGRS
jgi:dihydroxyacetone kinase